MKPYSNLKQPPTSYPARPLLPFRPPISVLQHSSFSRVLLPQSLHLLASSSFRLFVFPPALSPPHSSPELSPQPHLFGDYTCGT